MTIEDDQTQPPFQKGQQSDLDNSDTETLRLKEEELERLRQEDETLRLKEEELERLRQENETLRLEAEELDRLRQENETLRLKEEESDRLRQEELRQEELKQEDEKFESVWVGSYEAIEDGNTSSEQLDPEERRNQIDSSEHKIFMGVETLDSEMEEPSHEAVLIAPYEALDYEQEGPQEEQRQTMQKQNVNQEYDLEYYQHKYDPPSPHGYGYGETRYDLKPGSRPIDRHDVYTMETDAELDDARTRASKARVDHTNPKKFQKFLEKEERDGFQSDPTKRPLSQRYAEIRDQQQEMASQAKRGSKGPLTRQEIKLYESNWEKSARHNLYRGL